MVRGATCVKMRRLQTQDGQWAMYKFQSWMNKGTEGLSMKSIAPANCSGPQIVDSLSNHMPLFLQLFAASHGPSDEYVSLPMEHLCS